MEVGEERDYIPIATMFYLDDELMLNVFRCQLTY